MDQPPHGYTYPRTLDDVIGLVKADDYPKTRAYLLVFRDAEGSQVTLRLRDVVLDRLEEILVSRPKLGQS